MSRVLSRLVPVLAFLLLSGCSGGSGTSATDVTSSSVTIAPPLVGVSPTATPVAASTIGPAGGKVEVTTGALAGASVTIPPGALTRTVPITVTSASSLTAQGIEDWGSAVEFGPTGTTFNVPVTITLPIPAVPESLTPASFLVLRKDPNDVSVLLPSTLNDGDTRITVQSTSFSTFQPGVSGFRVTIVNNSGVPDDQVYVTQYGKNQAGTSFYYCLFDESPMQQFTTNAATPVGTRYSKPLTSLPFKDGARPHTYAYVSPFDNMHSGRIYVSLKGGINIGMNSGNGFQEQSLSGEPGYKTPEDFMELDCSTDNQNRQNIFVNTTNVDAFGLALSLELKTTKGSYRFGFDHTRSRNDVVQAFRTMPDAYVNGGAFGCFVMDGSTVVRVLSPVQLLALNRTGALSTYLDSAIDAGWTTYTGKALTVSYQGFSYTGQVTGGNLVMKCTAVPDGNATTGKVGDQYVFPKPTTEIVFQGTDPKGDPGYAGGVDQAPTRPWYNYTPDGGTAASVYRKDAHNKLTALITAAVIRGVFSDVTQWGVPTSYYKNSPYNNFSQILHQFAENGLCYGFGYDDIYEQAPAIGSPLGDLTDVNGLVITIPQYP